MCFNLAGSPVLLIRRQKNAWDVDGGMLFAKFLSMIRYPIIFSFILLLHRHRFRVKVKNMVSTNAPLFTISALYRYAVKGLGPGDSLDCVKLHPGGTFPDDR